MDLALTCMHENGVRYQAVKEDTNIKGIILFKDLTLYYKNKFITSKYR
jgi:hypothetical protein